MQRGKETNMFVKAKFMMVSAFVLLVAACSSGASEQEDRSQDTAGSSPRAARLEQGGEQAVPVQMQLILGTLKLETTNLAVDADQASELVPLWKALRSLSNSDTAAEAEIEALINQIQDAMTTEQIEAIAALEFAQEDMRTIIQELGLEFGPPEGFEGFEGGDFQFPPGGFGGGQGGQFRGGGQFGEGGAPGGGGGPFGGGGGAFQGGDGNFDPEAAATARAEAGFERFGGRAGSFLLEPLIELLEQRAGLESST
jgi:hypothetical protein